MSKFNDLINQIELFIRKYYKNEMLKGLLLFVSIFLFTFLLVSTLEYFGRFNQIVRQFFFFAFLGVNVFILISYIIIPLFKLNKLGKRLSLNQASKLIGSIFPDISDKLQNTLQLNAQLDNGSQNIDLIRASINQRSTSLSSIPFTTGIDLKENKRYFKYLLPVLLVVFAIMIFRPSIFSDGSKRVMNYGTEFIEEAPFMFSLLSPDSIMQGEAYDLNIKLDGEEMPNEVKIVSNIGTYNLEKLSIVEFSHHFANVDKHIEFYCVANGFKSKTFNVNVLQKPIIDKVVLKLNYPKHTGITSEEVNDINDITIPEGTLIEWLIESENTTIIKSVFEDTVLVEKPNSNGEFNFKKQFANTTSYQFLLSTMDVIDADTMLNGLTVIPDSYPSITVMEEKDSLNPLTHFFNGTITDDYGFSGLKAIVKVVKEDTSYRKSFSVDINLRNTNQIFGYALDFSDYDLGPGDQLEYFFIVTDNDSPNGYKSASSSRQIFKVPDLDELDDLLSEQSDELKKEMDKALKDAQKLKKNISEIKNDLINKNTPDWKDKQSIENMMNLQKDLEQQLNQLKEQFDDNSAEENEFLDNSEELQEKQELLEKLMEELMDDEMKELLEELQKMMDEMNKDDLLNNMEKMEQKSESLEKELDRTLELFKHLELDKKIENIEEQLRELAEEQKELEELTEDKSLPAEELEKLQEELNEKFESIKEDIDDAEEMNEALEEPEDLDFNEEAEQKIEEEMQDSKESLSEGKEKKASESQKKAAEMMEQMADDLAAMQSSASMEQESEDMDKLRFLLENIVTLSHQEENLMIDYGKINRLNPLVVDYNRNQIEIDKSVVIVRDSLEALAKRHAQLSNTILSELSDLDYNLQKAIDMGEERNLGKVKQHQQYAMTSFNDLALLLSDVLEQMQNQMKSKMPGTGSCDKPGGSGSGKPSSKMSMQQMKDQMKEANAEDEGWG